MKRVVSFGEIMLRLSPPGHERFFQSPELRTYFGGSEANVAVSLAHFGVRSDYVTRVPANALGDGPARAAQQAATVARGIGATVSLDLNYRPALWAGRDPSAVIRPLAESSDVLIANPGAVDAMLGIRVDGALEWEKRLTAIAARVHEELGCGQVAMTHREVLSSSEHGWSAALYEASGKNAHASRRYQVRIVDRVGGGDSFAAALIFARSSGRAGLDAVRFATAASALKLTIPGDFNRVSAEEVDRLLEASE